MTGYTGFFVPFGEMKPLLAVLTLVLYLLHQDFWFWREAHPLLLGFLPPALWYHGLYTLAVSLLMAALVRYAWPSDLEREVLEEEARHRAENPAKGESR